jgi:hypothetical protein
MQQQMKGAEHDSTIVQLQQAAVLPGDVPAGGTSVSCLSQAILIFYSLHPCQQLM